VQVRAQHRDELSRSMVERDELASKLNEQFALVASLRREKDAMSQTSSHTDETVSAISELQQRLEKEVQAKKALQAKLDSQDTSDVSAELRDQISELKHMSQVRDELFKESELRVKQLTDASNAQTDQVATLESSENALKQRVEDLQSELAAARSQIEELKESIVASAASHDQSASEVAPAAEDASSSVPELQQSLAAKSQQVAVLEERVKKNKLILAKAHQHITDSTKQLIDGREELAKAKLTNDELSNKILTLERSQQQLIDEAVREQLKAQLEKHINSLVRQQREKESDYVRVRVKNA
jgi:nucleoprotein TPR